MYIRDLLFFLRDSLLAARRDKDLEQIHHLMVTFFTIVDSAYEKQDKAVAGLLEDMEAAARDSLNGVEWKSEIPTDEDILNATKN